MHGDLKPDNVMLGRDGRVLIADFGMARDPVASQGGATIGLVVETRRTWPPSRSRPSPEWTRARGHLRAGCHAVELFTGRVPWTGSSPMAVAAARLCAIPNAKSVAPEVPAALAALGVMRCMARRESARPASANQVRDALAAASPSPAEGAT